MSIKGAEGLYNYMNLTGLWNMSCAIAGWTTSNDMAPAGPQGWAESDEWVDDSAAAAGRFFEAGTKPARPGSQGWASSSWPESSSLAADE